MEPVRVFSNRYELTQLIARGGMAQVYQARDRLLDRPVAIKVLFPELSVDRAFVERFRREAQAAANLSHQNIVPVFDWGEDNGTYFIVMEYIDGQPLSAHLRAQGPSSASQVADIGMPVAAALTYAHRHGVVHRDVKPGNILITDDGQVKVTDFGIARALNTEESLTQTGAVMGTATYFSPEQAEGVGVDARSDIYSLGVVLFEMVAGRPPFMGDSPVAVASKHVRDMPPDLRQLAPGISPELVAVIGKAMAKSPDDRYSTADELRADLRRFSDGQPVQATLTMANTMVTHGQVETKTSTIEAQGTVIDPEGELRRKRTRRLLLVLLGLLVLLAIVSLLLLKSLGYIGKTTIALPSLQGKSLVTATQVIDADGLHLGKTNHVTSTSIPTGDVITTSPPPGTVVHKGSAVGITVSSGLPTVMETVPSVLNSQLTDAEALLSNNTLKFKVTFVNSSAAPGTVVAQNPMAGKSVPQNSVVTLSVPKATTLVTVPNVVGMNSANAGRALGTKGLQVGATTTECSNSFGKTLVASSTPAGGTNVHKSSSVALVISTGPCQAALPNVLNLSESAAKTKLSSEGFSNVTEDKVKASSTTSCSITSNGLVTGETPTAGSTLKTTTLVTLSICDATLTTTTTTTTTTSGPTPKTRS